MEKRAIRMLVLLVMLAVSSPAMVNVTAQRIWEPGGEAMPLFSLGVMHRTPFQRQYFETGVMVRPVAHDAIVGTYGGYYYTIWPIFRPGILLGVGFDRLKDWKAGLYYGISIQGGIFTFVATGQGIGGGLNIPLRRR